MNVKQMSDEGRMNGGHSKIQRGNGETLRQGPKGKEKFLRRACIPQPTIKGKSVARD